MDPDYEDYIHYARLLDPVTPSTTAKKPTGTWIKKKAADTFKPNWKETSTRTWSTWYHPQADPALMGKLGERVSREKVDSARACRRCRGPYDMDHNGPDGRPARTWQQALDYCPRKELSQIDGNKTRTSIPTKTEITFEEPHVIEPTKCEE